MNEAAIRISGVAKSFGPVQANRDASLVVARGEVHALVGENGAGKSTLMRILAGMFAPDTGTIEVADASGALRDVTGWSTADAIAAGVGMVHQHFMLVPTLTVAENVVLGRELTRGPVLDRARAEREVRELSERTGLRVDPSRLVSTLTVGEAQRVEILKVLYRGARILILDEPTAVLSPPEVLELWKVLGALRDGGGTIVLITHKLDEVLAISESITVMRAGRTVGQLQTSEATAQSIARMMVGRDVNLALEQRAGARTSGTTPVLVVTDLRVASARGTMAVDGVSLTVHAGEIVGIAGVEGNGQTELIDAITGLRPVTSGSIRLRLRDGMVRLTPDGTSPPNTLEELSTLPVRARSDLGLSHVPEDRHHRGLLLDYSVADNLILGQQRHFTRGASLDGERIARNAERKIREYDIRPSDPSLPARALSGGNQQKVVIAREMGRDFVALIAAQPTRGVDVGAIEFIHAQLRAARDAGKAILLLSADLVEVLALADRVAVMYGGRIVVDLPRAEASSEVLGPYMTGAQMARIA